MENNNKVKIEVTRQETDEDGNVHINRRLHEYHIVAEVGNRYIGVREDGSYSVFEINVSKLVNPTNKVTTINNESDISILNSLCGPGELIVHGDISKLDNYDPI